MFLSPVLNRGLLRVLGLTLCYIALFVFARITRFFRNKYEVSKLSCLGMVFLDLFLLTSSNVSFSVALNRDLLTLALAKITDLASFAL